MKHKVYILLNNKQQYFVVKQLDAIFIKLQVGMLSP